MARASISSGFATGRPAIGCRRSTGRSRRSRTSSRWSSATTNSRAPRRSSLSPIGRLRRAAAPAGMPIAAGIARATATIGLSAVYFQDMFGIITFDQGFASMAAIRPRVGRGHVIHCLDAYQGRVGMEDVKAGRRARDDDRRAPAPDDAPAGDFGFSVRGRAGAHQGAGRAQLGARRVSRHDRQRVRVRAAGRVGGMGHRVRRRDGRVAADVAAGAARPCAARARVAGRSRAPGARARARRAAARRRSRSRACRRCWNSSWCRRLRKA